MKKISPIVAIVIAFLMSNCEKTPLKREECETKRYGTVTITNNSSDPYYIYINDNYYGKLKGDHFYKDVQVNEGSLKLKAEQADGFYLYPTVKEDTYNIERCEDMGWVIP